MAAPALRQGISVAGRSSAAALASSRKGLSLAEKLDQQREEELQSQTQAQKELHDALRQQPARQEVLKSFAFHVGGDLHLPTDDKRRTHEMSPSPTAAVKSDPFEGLPLRAWAERMGERIMPAYELIKEEQRKAKFAAKQETPKELPVPAIPHLLPFTRWAAQNRSIRSTFIADDAKTRKKARLSWYHPDDTMVPRNWFKGGLLEDLKYYAPFKRAQPGTAAQ